MSIEFGTKAANSFMAQDNADLKDGCGGVQHPCRRQVPPGANEMWWKNTLNS